MICRLKLKDDFNIEIRDLPKARAKGTSHISVMFSPRALLDVIY